MSMTSREFVLETMKRNGKMAAQTIQDNAENMTGTELYDNYGYIPSFYAACANKNMLERKIGFVCRSPQGRVVKLIQPYDSTIYAQEPEELTAHWGFKWSTNPKHALPFFKSAESPYGEGECCIWNDEVYRSKIIANVYSPEEYPQGWEVVVDEPETEEPVVE